MTGRVAAAWRSDVVQSLVAVLLRLAAAAASYALFAVAARVLGPTGFGTFSTYFSAAMLAGLLGSFGQQIFLLKEIPRARERGRRDEELGLYVYALVVTVSAASLASGVVLGLVRVLGWSGSHGLLLAVFGLTWTFAASQTTMGALRVQDRTLSAMATRDLVWRMASIVTLAVVAAVWGVAIGAGGVLAILAAALVPIVGLHVVWVAGHVRRTFAGVPPRIRWRPWLETSLGMAVVSAVSSADLYAYTLVLGVLLTTTETGAFFAALKTVELLNLFLMAVTLVVAPELSRLAARGDAEKLQRKCNAALLLQGVPAVLAGVVMILVAAPLLGIFAPEYAAFAGLLRLLVLGMLINALTGATVLLLQLGGGHWLQVALQGTALALALASLPLLVEGLGVYSAGLAFVVSKGLWNVAAIVAIRRRFGVDPSLLGLAVRSSGGVRGAWGELRSQLADRTS